MLRSSLAFAFFALLLAGSAATGFARGLTQQSRSSQTPEPPVKTDKNAKAYTAENVAEATIYVYGSRPVLNQIRRNGVERGRLTRFMADGKSEEASYERRFIRGESIDKDKVRLDQKTPSLEYSLIYGDGRLWGIINGASFVPREDAANTFRSQHRHSIDSLLRYKENGSTITVAGKKQEKGLDLYMLDLVDKDKKSTRYYISAKTFQVLWLEYEEAPSAGAAPLKYLRKFLDYRLVQSTRVPYRTVLLEEGRQTQETRIMTITYGVKIDDAVFKNPELRES